MKLVTLQDVSHFWKSTSGIELLKFIDGLNVSVQGLSNNASTPTTDRFNAVVHEQQHAAVIWQLDSLLEKLTTRVQECPILDRSTRFGHPKFREWLDFAEFDVHEYLENLFSSNYHGQVIFNFLDRFPEMEQSSTDLPVAEQCKLELKGYLLDSFGNRQRIDYGTGHELHFMCFLFCLSKLGFLDNSTSVSVVFVIFRKYLQLMRLLQVHFWLEPAGSQGVWGLDDYHFLPFLFGSSQLIGHAHLKPKSIHIQDNLEGFSKDYMYLEAIQFICATKDPSIFPENSEKVLSSASDRVRHPSVNGLRWHSPMLDDISAVKSWTKVNTGLWKMYQADVLHKLPIMQHFYIGKLCIPFENTSSLPSLTPNNTLGSCCRPDCCGIRVPSAMAAAEAKDGKTLDKRFFESEAARTAYKIPFD